MHHVLSEDTLGALLPLTTTQGTASIGGVRHVGADRTIVVHRYHDPNLAPSPVDQLLSHARTIVPAVLNYIYFGAADMAVVYFGKSVRNGQKWGIDGADDMKIRMLRFLTTEIWPQLLRTDVPDESQAATDAECGPLIHVQSYEENVDQTEDASSSLLLQLRRDQRQSWLKRSLESGMQVLVYLKPGALGSKYLKLVLSNSPRRIHFDIIDSREERFRWDNRMLHIRMLDNLETQKAIDSYETYERYFKEACAFASRHCAELEKPDQPLVSVVFHDGLAHHEGCVWAALGAVSATTSPARSPRRTADFPNMNLLGTDHTQRPTSPSCSSSTGSTAGRRKFVWFENLEKPESLTLDYKSYFMHPAMEIQSRAVKFMCGFLNGIGQGKLVVGVHEMERADLAEVRRSNSRNQTRSSNNGSIGGESPSLLASTTSDQVLESGNTIVTHNMLVEQLVVGIAITDQEIASLQVELSEQLQQCIPPIPPQAVQLDVIPVVFPASDATPGYLILLYDTTQAGWKDGFRQKGNNAIRQLRRYGYSMCPYDFCERSELKSRFPSLEALMPKGTVGWQLYAVCPTTCASASSPSSATVSDDSQQQQPPLTVEWLQGIMDSCSGRNKGKHLVHEVPTLHLPQLRIVEVSVNLHRCPAPLSHYKGKFFNGWPSIPIWNPMTDTITRVDRNYHMFTNHAQRPHRKTRRSHATPRSGTENDEPGSDDADARLTRELLPTAKSRWYCNASIVSTILAYSCGGPRTARLPRALAKLRLLHSSFNAAFEMSLGVPLVEMLRSTPVGTPGFVITRETMSLLQTSLRVSRLSTLPLLLVHIYEMLGSLLSPFPYVSTPASMQSVRLHPNLVPLYMYHDYETMTFRMEIVLDTEDGFIKVVRGSPTTGAFTLEVVQGIGFARVSRKLLESRAMQASLPRKSLDRKRSLRSLRSSSRSRTHLNTSQLEAGASMLGVRAETAEFRSPTSSSGMASPQRSGVVGGDPGTPLTSSAVGGVSTVRRLEPNVPVLRFSFLFGEFGKLFHSAPWTLTTLLNWLQAAAHDPHVHPFGHCDRSFGFYPDLNKEVCVAHIGDDDLFDGDSNWEVFGSSHESPKTCSVYASSFDCTVCRLVVEWNSNR